MRLSESIRPRSRCITSLTPTAPTEVVAALAERLPASEPVIVTDLGPVLALHVGAGALAVCVEVAGEVPD